MGGSRGRVHRGAPGPHSIRGRAALAAVSIPVRVSARISCVRSPAKAPLSVPGTRHTMRSRPAAEPPFLMEGTHMTASVLAQQSGNVTFLISLALMVAIFYFLLIRPQQKRARQQRQLVGSLAVGDEASLTLEDVQQDPVLSAYISAADRVMDGLGFTEHGFRHANLTARIAYNVMSRLGFGERDAQLAAVGGYLHDIGNAISRWGHGQTGAVLVHHVLSDRLPPADLGYVLSAVGNHEEDDGMGAGPIAAAVILADKSDVHRSRVRKTAQIDFDIHDRVNYAAEQSFLRVDADAKTITLELKIDTSISHVMEYFEIFLGRMVMCRRAAEQLDCSFHLDINGASLL